MRYGYARVSSRKQQIDGNSLEAQTKALTEAGAETIVLEIYTGTKVARPKLQELIDIVKEGDYIIVTKLDRFARTVSEATTIINKLIEKGVKLHVLDLGILDNSSMSVLMRNLILSFAQFERDMIIERTQEGRELARMRPGYVEGRPPKYGKPQIDLAMKLLEDYSYSQVSLMTGISISTLTRAKRKRKNLNLS